jgi:hypothetical protein
MNDLNPVGYVVNTKELVVRGRFLKTARLRSEFHVSVGDPRSFLRELKQTGLRADIVTFVQEILEPAPKYSFPYELEKMAVLPITTYDDWFKKQLYNKPRNMIRKALKSGIEIRLEEFSEPLLEGIKAVYDETPIRQGKRNYHYGEDLAKIRREHSTFLERSQFIAVYDAGHMVGFGKVTFSQGCGIVMNFLSKVSHRDKAVNNAILAKVVEICADRQLKCIVYGHWGSEATRGLVEFKTAHGFQCVEIPRYFVPLTGLGRLALSAGVHRGLVHRLPKWCIEPAANVRKRWNAFRFRAVTPGEASR